MSRIIRDDVTIDADVLAVHRRTLFAMVAPQAEERGVGIAVFERVMEVVAGSGAWDAVIVALQRRGLWPPPAVQRPRYEDGGDDPTPDSSASKV